MMLIDKGYYDYDYEEPPESRKREERLVTVEETKKSNEEVMSALSAFGWGKPKEKKPDAKELQEIVMKDIQTRNKNKEG